MPRFQGELQRAERQAALRVKMNVRVATNAPLPLSAAASASCGIGTPMTSSSTSKGVLIMTLIVAPLVSSTENEANLAGGMRRIVRPPRIQL